MITKEKLVSTYKSKYPSLGKYSDDKVYGYLVNKFPEYKQQVVQSENHEADSMFDGLPDFIKKAYNDSITGMAQEMATGKKKFDLSGYEPGVVEDIASGLVSFLMPADLITTVASGGIGAVGAKKLAGKYLVKKLRANGVKTGAASIAKKTAMNIGSSTAGLASYEGLKSALSQKLNTGDIKLGEVVKDTASGAVLGGVTAGTGAYLTTRGWSTMNKVLAEAGVLGTTMPITEGEVPTPQDYVNATGMLLGIKGAGQAFKMLNPSNINKYLERGRAVGSKRKQAVSDEIAQEYGIAEGEALSKANFQNQNYLDKNNKNWRIISEPESKLVHLIDYKGNQKKIKPSSFTKQYKLAEQKNLSFEQVKKDNISRIKSLEESINIGDEALQNMRLQSLRPSRSSDISKIGKNINGVPLQYLKSDELFNYTQALQKKSNVIKAIDKIKADGWVVQEAKSSILKGNFFPETIKNALQGLTRAKYRGTQSVPLRKFLADVGSFSTEKDGLIGEYLGRLINTGLMNPSRSRLRAFRKKGMNAKEAEEAYFVDLYDKVKDGKLPEIQAVTNLIAERFTSKGGTIAGFQANYVPDMMQREIADIVFDDMLSVLQKRKTLSDRFSGSDIASIDKILFEMKDNIDDFINSKENKGLAKYLNTLIERSMPKFKNETRLMFQENASSQSLPFLRAFHNIGFGLTNELFRQFGNLEKAKKFKIPEALKEKNLKTILTRYATKAAERTSFIQHFGAKGEKFKALRNNVDISDQNIMNELFHHVKGDVQYNINYNWTPKVKDFWQKVMSWETGTKITLGFAPLMNVTQSLISTALEAGYAPFFRGIFALTNKKTRELIERSGATNYSLFNELIGISQAGKTQSKVLDNLSKYSGFNGINKINQIVAASTAKGWVDDLLKTSKGKGIRGKTQTGRAWARSKLQQLGVDPSKKRLLDDDYVKAMSTFARKTQLHKDILEDPIFFNNPKYMPFVQFKRFGLRQANYIKDLMIHDISHYNVMPILRLAIAGVAGGAIASKGKEFMRNLVSGEEVINPESKLPEDLLDIVDNLSAVGAFGFVGDISSSLFEEGKNAGNVGKFLLSPPFLSDIDNLLTRFIPAVQKDFTTYRADALKRMPTRLLRLSGSSLLREGAKRFETDGMKIDRVKNMKSRRVAKVLDMLEKASKPNEYDEAYEYLNSWNKSFPNNPILNSDIDIRKIYKRKLRRYKKRALG